jgi:hypothetical protein
MLDCMTHYQIWLIITGLLGIISLTLVFGWMIVRWKERRREQKIRSSRNQPYSDDVELYELLHKMVQERERDDDRYDPW